MFDKNLAIVDIETTGTSAIHDRIIEIAIFRVENNKIVDKYSTLINPQTYVSPFIVNFTGIRREELAEAPVFNDIKEKVIELLTGAVFIAHNVRFDYTFIKSELKRVGIPFKAKTCCTVRLSRRLFPEHKSHSLQSVIERFNFNFIDRHRAYDDAHILWQFLQKIQKTIPKNEIKKAWETLTKSLYSADANLKKQIEALPETPGVYVFYNKKNIVLYVGKSKNISERVISHFSGDGLSTKHLTMIKDISRVDFVQTAGELGALIRETQMVKKLNPIYNRQLREKKRFYVIVRYKNNDGFLTFKSKIVENFEELKFEDVLGIFNSKASIKTYLSELANKYSLCERLLGTDSGKTSCFGYKLGKCKGACIKKEKPKKYNARFLIAFIENKQFNPWPFRKPIEIVEKSQENESWESFKIDRWCLIEQKNSKGNEQKYGYSFDVDCYRIYSRYLKTKKGIVIS